MIEDGACYVNLNDGSKAIKVRIDRVLLTPADLTELSGYLRQLADWLDQQHTVLKS